MRDLAQWRLEQHEHDRIQSDHQLEKFLTEIPLDVARLDLLPHTPSELLHLTRTNGTDTWSS
jgi:hypothetical protein